ncbi:MAG TPA: hypothetical protein VIF15_13815 [Polyangiaceae bacterium]|jgi:hypothetical protein
MSEPAVELPSGLDQAFGAVAGELGQATTAWLFVRAVARCAGDGGVASLAERAGPEYPVLDAVARGWLAGLRKQTLDPLPVLAAIGKANRLVVVGMEATPLDALMERLDPAVKVAMITHSPFPVDWDRVLDNYAGRIERVDLDTFQNWAGGKSALLTFAYGHGDTRTVVPPLWLRACGADVRAQFRALVAWNVLEAPLQLYPRWLVEIDADSFTHFVS